MSCPDIIIMEPVKKWKILSCEVLYKCEVCSLHFDDKTAPENGRFIVQELFGYLNNADKRCRVNAVGFLISSGYFIEFTVFIIEIVE